MSTFNRLHQYLAIPLVMVMLISTFPVNMAHANIVGTDQLIEESMANTDRERVLDFMARDDVRKQMRTLGVDPDEAISRVDSLSDSEIRQIADRIDTLPAGEGHVVGPIVGALVLVFVILLVTDLLCLTDIFPFTKCAR